MGIFNRIEKRIAGFIEELSERKKLMESLRYFYPTTSYRYEKATLDIAVVDLKIAIWEEVRGALNLWK